MTLRTITSDQFSQNPDIWGRELAEKIEIEAFLFSDHYGSLHEREIDLPSEDLFAGIPRVDNRTPAKRKEIILDALINNAFLSMFRDVVVYIDKVLSLYIWSKQTQDAPIAFEDILDIEHFLENQPNEEYKKWTRSKLTFPDKILFLKTLNKRSSSRLTAYNDIRVSFEHHGGIAKKDITLPLSKFEISDVAPDGLNHVNINMTINDDQHFKKDSRIKLYPQDIAIISHDIRGWIIKDILLAIDELDKDEKP
ncbi:MAG: hypothetical protein Q8L81_14565 [Bacteroidota bacterium]|nr:hypothetical protein [Bacteroidota bacterium]